MFLIIAIIVVIFLVTLKIASEPAQRITRPGEFNVENIRSEFTKVQKYTAANQSLLIDNMNDFNRFMVDRLSQRKIGLSGLYVNGFLDKTNTTNINITVGNFLGTAITNINVSFGNATGQQGSFIISSLANNASGSNNITFATTAQEKHINVTYTKDGSNSSLFYTFTPKENQTTISTVYDITYRILDKITKDKFIQTDYR